MKIQSINSKSMKHAELFQYNETNISLLQRFQSSVIVKVSALFLAYKQSFENFDIAFKKILKSVFTDPIQNLDAGRDETYNGLVDACKSALKHFVPEIKAAAKKLMVVFNSYGNISKKPLAEQTALTTNLIQELRSDKFKADVALLRLKDWVDELERRNISVKETMSERNTETTEGSDLATKQARAELIKNYKTLVDQINALILVEGPADYEGYVKEINSEIDRMKNVVKTRMGVLAAAKKREADKKAAEEAE